MQVQQWQPQAVVHPWWTSDGRQERALQRDFRTVDRRVEMEGVREMAAGAARAARQHADLIEYMAAMTGAMTLYDVGMSRAGDDPVRQVIAMNFTQMYVDSRQVMFLKEAEMLNEGRRMYPLPPSRR